MFARASIMVMGAALLTPGAAVAGASTGPPPTAITSVAAVAAPTWGPAVTLAKNPENASVVIDGKGRVTAVWRSLADASSIVVRRHRPGHPWTKAKTIGHGVGPELAVDAHGTVTVAWVTVRKGWTDGVVVSRHPDGGTWSDPVRISRDVQIPGYPKGSNDHVGAADIHVAVGSKTGVVVAWQWGSENRPRPFRIQAAVLPPGGPWRAPYAVTPANGSEQVGVGIAGDGTTFITFTGTADRATRRPLRVRHRSPQGTWSATTALAPDVESWQTELAVNRGGDAAVGFFSRSEQLSIVYKPRHQAWRARERVVPGARVDGFSLGLVGNGAVVVALIDDNHAVQVGRRAPGGAWSALHELDPDLTAMVDVATNPAGDVLVSWGYWALYASYLHHGGSWTPRYTVAPYLDALESWDTAVTLDGDAVALWDQESAPLRARLLNAD